MPPNLVLLFLSSRHISSSCLKVFADKMEISSLISAPVSLIQVAVFLKMGENLSSSTNSDVVWRPSSMPAHLFIVIDPSDFFAAPFNKKLCPSWASLTARFCCSFILKTEYEHVSFNPYYF